MKKTLGIIIGLAIIALVGYGIVKISDKERADAERVIALVNGEEVKKNTLDSQISQLELNPQVTVPAENNVSERKDFEMLILDNIINEILFYQEAVKLGFAATAEEITEQYDLVVSQFGSVEAFRAQVEAYGLTEAQINKDIEKFIAIDKFQGSLFEGQNFEVTEEEILAFYDNEVLSLGLEIELEDIREQILAEIENQKRIAIIDGTLAEIKSNSTIEILL